MVSRVNGAHIHVHLSSHMFLFSAAEAMKSRKTKKMVLEQTMIPPDSVFISHRYLWNEGAEQCCKSCLCHHVDLVPNAVEMLDVIALAYETGFYLVVDCKDMDAVEPEKEVKAPEDTSSSPEIYAIHIPDDNGIAICT